VAIPVPTPIGSATPAGANAATIAFTTNVTVPSGAKIVVFTGFAGATSTLTNITGGSLTWTTAPPLPVNGSIKCACAYADAPSGLASGTTITANYANTPGSRYLAGVYITGAATGGPSTSNSGTTGTTNWTSGTMTVTNNGILLGMGYGGAGTTSGTNTPTNGNGELFDQNISTDTSFAVEFQVGRGVAAQVSGTWSVDSSPNTALGVVFDPTGTSILRIGPDVWDFPHPPYRVQ